MPPQQILAGRYALIERVGDGRMSTVFRAQDLRRGHTPVAVKVLNTGHPDAIRRELFRRETLALERLAHRHVVTIVDHGQAAGDGAFYIVLEWLSYTLADLIARAPEACDRAWCYRLLAALADALVYAHSEGIIHRDIKPSNVLFDAALTPRLSDFGISRLRYELSTGQTVGGFWSPGYAPPEQRQGEPGDERSDLYAFGAVAYHLLARQVPPAAGPTPELVSQLRLPPTVDELLRRLLSTRPADRPRDAAEVRDVLVGLDRQVGQVPELLLLVTDQARLALHGFGLINRATQEAACEWLIEELGGDELRPVGAVLDRSGGVVRLFGRQARLTCAPDLDSPALVVREIDLLYAPNLEAARAAALPVRRLWQPVSLRDCHNLTMAEKGALAGAREELLNELASHNRRAAASKERRDERRAFVESWEQVLRLQQRLLDQAGRPLAYDAVVIAEDLFTFRLHEPAPDDLPWVEGSALAVTVAEEHRTLSRPVGRLLSVVGTTVQVVRESPPSPLAWPTDRPLPPSGQLSLSVAEERAALRRQNDALRQLRAGEASNPRLADVLADLSRAEFDDPDPDLAFVQADLAEDKREAVRQALATRDIFLLQGPPGTGKTTTIAEIIVQLLTAKPDVRILVSSQSNVPVNHVLSRVAALQPDVPLEIVRLGRPEKIGQGAKAWGLEQRMEAWRNQVVARARARHKELEAEARRRGRELRAARTEAPPADTLDLCRAWLEEALERRAALRQEEDRLVALTVPLALESGATSVNAPGGVAERAAEAVGLAAAEGRAALEEHVATIREFLGGVARGEPCADLDAEIARLQAAILELAEPGAADDPTVERRRLLREWIMVFGRTEEFARPLLRRANILAATCLYAGVRALKDEIYDWAIIDEAGRATAPEILIPLVRAKRAILVGDERQLPPMLDENLTPELLAEAGVEAADLERSLFETLVREAERSRPEAVRMLTVQHRMHPAIGQMISDVFYEGRLTHGVAAVERDHRLSWAERPVLWFSTSRLERREEERRGTSRANPAEVAVVERLLGAMEESYRSLDATREVGVIAGYSGQIDELRARLAPDDRRRWRALDIEVATVDAFQGRDRDVVIYSTVRSNRSGELGFLRDRRRLNVALSRARQMLILVGDSSMFEGPGDEARPNPFADVISYIRVHPDDCALRYWDLTTIGGLRG